MRHDYANGTYMETGGPWQTFIGGAAKCADGRVRRLARVAATADTFFSVPAYVRVRGKFVSGYVTTRTVSGSDVVTDDDPAEVQFRAYAYGRNGHLLAD